MHWTEKAYKGDQARISADTATKLHHIKRDVAARNSNDKGFNLDGSQITPTPEEETFDFAMDSFILQVALAVMVLACGLVFAFVFLPTLF